MTLELEKNFEGDHLEYDGKDVLRDLVVPHMPLEIW